MTEVILGHIIEARTPEAATITENGCIVLVDGVIEGVYDAVPPRYRAAPVVDYRGKLILQGFTDMHLHAPQYTMMGLGMDLPLLEWLKTYTFPTEAHFVDADYAVEVYERLASALIQNGTTRVCMFSSIHTPATLALMQALEYAGVCGYVGKVNMDRNGGPNYQETTDGSMRDTLSWLNAARDFRRVKPIITPRFTPACTDELMAWLGSVAEERGLPVQSHLSENLAEVQWVKALCPDCTYYWQTYDRYGLFNERTVMAHCVHLSGDEMDAMASRGVLAAHCPLSNINICSGFPDVRALMAHGVQVALGSDVAGGDQLSMLSVMAAAIRMSKAVRIASDWQTPFLSVSEAYYMGTTAGARFFGAGAGFAAGDRLHAVVIDDQNLPSFPAETVRERFERAVYLAGKSDIVAVYADGRRVDN